MKRLQFILVLGLLSVSSTFAGAHLGGTIGEFQAAWGRPTTQERVDRTARLVWGPFDHQTDLPLRVREAGVDFLDNGACAIAFRGRVGVDESWGWVVRNVRRVVPNCPREVPRPEPNFEGERQFKMNDGTLITVRKFKRRTLVIIEGRVFYQNQEVFVSETAKVHPPKRNH